MSKPILTPEQKQIERKRKNLLFLVNSTKSAWSNDELHKWEDVYAKLGYDKRYIEGQFSKEQRAKVLVFPELKGYLDSLLKEFDDNNKPKEQHEESSFKLEQEDELVNAKDYGLIPSPNEKAFLYWFQKKAVKEMLDKVCNEGKSGVLLLSSTGTGKTYMVGAFLRRLMDRGWHEGKTFSHIPYLYLTKTTIVEQTIRAFGKNFDITSPGDVEIVNLEKLRSSGGKMWIKEINKIVGGEEVTEYKWKPMIHPPVTCFDESQGAKNIESKQSQIMCAYSDLPKDNVLVSISATPFTRVSEAKCFAVSTHAPIESLGFPKGTTLSNGNWTAFAKAIAFPNDPEEYVEASVERLMKFLDPWVVRVRGVRPQFEAINKVEKIRFKTAAEREFYDKAYARLLERQAKRAKELDQGMPGESQFAIMQAFALAAEVCRYEQIADRMWESVKSGFAACAAVKYKATLIAIEQCLENKYGVNRNDISLVWGGGQTQLTAKQKAKKKMLEMSDKLREQGLDVQELMEETGLDKIEDRELLNLPESSRLGSQSLEERQHEIDAYQSGRSLYCIYTFKAGGVGLSLHHTDELTERKCKRKESGYAVESDIPNIPTRPRRNIVAPTYSAIELVQGLGRVPRLTSLSNSEQVLLFYTGTIEDEISAIVSQKLRCLSKVVRMNEKWMDVVTGAPAEKFIESTKDLKDDERGTIVDADSTEEGDEE